MARKLEQKQNAASNAKPKAIEIASTHNLTGFDGEQLIADIGKAIKLADDVREAGVPASDNKKKLKSERGYHMGAFSVCVKLERMDPVEAHDFWQTIKTYADHKGLAEPDLVDRMQPPVEEAAHA